MYEGKLWDYAALVLRSTYASDASGEEPCKESQLHETHDESLHALSGKCRVASHAQEDSSYGRKEIWGHKGLGKAKGRTQ